MSFGIVGISFDSRADTVTVTGGPTAGPPLTTMVPNIPTPAGTQQSVFTTYSNNYGYALLPFTVTQTGVYSASLTTTQVTNTTWFLTGTFSPSPSPTQPVTPIGNFFAGLFAGSSVPYTDSFTNLSLTAGTQYSVLVAFNTGGNPAQETYSLSITGPGCTTIGSNVCIVAPVPTLSRPMTILYGLAIALAGVLFLTWRRTVLAKRG